MSHYSARSIPILTLLLLLLLLLLVRSEVFVENQDHGDSTFILWPHQLANFGTLERDYGLEVVTGQQIFGPLVYTRVTRGPGTWSLDQQLQTNRGRSSETD